MAAKPSSKTILQTYSLGELLDLVKEKSQLDAEEQLDAARQQIAALAQTMGGAVMSVPAVRAPKTAGRGRGRPKKTGAVAKAPAKAGRRGRKKVPLGKLLQEVIGSEPMGIESIMAALKASGYKSKSKDPRRVLYLELKKQVENKKLKKTGRGLYALK